jgi:hypothetical protein
MSDNFDLEKQPRADKLRVENDHNDYALHSFWGEYAHLPMRFRAYHAGRVINDEERPVTLTSSFLSPARVTVALFSRKT